MNWKKVKLEEYIKISKGKKHEEVAFSEDSKRYIQIEDLSKSNNIKFTNDNGVEVSEYDVIIAWDGANAGKVGTDLKGVIGSTLARLKILKRELNHKFFYRYLDSRFELIKSQRTGATIPHVSGDALKNLEIPLPDLTTQQHIAKVLDQADALRQQNRQLLAHYDELLQSTFIDLFGDPVKNEKGWEVKKLNKVCTQITDGTHFSPPSVDSGIPYITAKHVKDYGVDFYNKPTYVSIDEHEKIYSRCKPEKGDVLYIKDGATTGIAAVNPYDFEFSMLSSLALIKPLKKELTSQFLVSWLNSEQVKENLISEFMAGAAIKRFTLQKIKSFQIPVPPLPLQQQFAQIVEQIEEQKAVVKQSLAESKVLFEGLLAEYFE